MQTESLRTAALAILVLLGGCAEPPPVTVEDARVRALIPGQDKTAAYMTLRNHTNETLTLTAASAEQVRAIEFHTTRLDGGVMRMRRLPSVDVRAGEAVRFRPGGRHLMLFGVTSLPAELEIQLEFADGTRLMVPFEQVEIGNQ
jgi:copper(I)-binding protein